MLKPDHLRGCHGLESLWTVAFSCLTRVLPSTQTLSGLPQACVTSVSNFIKMKCISHSLIFRAVINCFVLQRVQIWQPWQGLQASSKVLFTQDVMVMARHAAGKSQQVAEIASSWSLQTWTSNWVEVIVAKTIYKFKMVSYMVAVCLLGDYVGQSLATPLLLLTGKRW